MTQCRFLASGSLTTTTTACLPAGTSFYQRENSLAFPNRVLRRIWSGAAKTSASRARYRGSRSGCRSAIWCSRSSDSSTSTFRYGHGNRVNEFLRVATDGVLPATPLQAFVQGTPLPSPPNRPHYFAVNLKSARPYWSLPGIKKPNLPSAKLRPGRSHLSRGIHFWPS